MTQVCEFHQYHAYWIHKDPIISPLVKLEDLTTTTTTTILNIINIIIIIIKEGSFFIY